jgi:hypothetical protein
MSSTPFSLDRVIGSGRSAAIAKAWADKEAKMDRYGTSVDNCKIHPPKIELSKTALGLLRDKTLFCRVVIGYVKERGDRAR